MEEDELLDGLIVGTPTINLRTQAKLQRFENRGRMLRAFADIMLPTRAAGSNKMQSSQSDPASKETRCYNCNGKGHWAMYVPSSRTVFARNKNGPARNKHVLGVVRPLVCTARSASTSII